jgi:hypothetical protein
MTAYPMPRNPATRPAPMPREAPVTITTFWGSMLSSLSMATVAPWAAGAIPVAGTLHRGKVTARCLE